MPDMRVLSIVHQIDAGSGIFGAVAERRGDEVVEWIPAQGPAPDGDFGAVMVFGGGMHPDQEEQHSWLAGEKELIRGWVERRTPILATCLGSELLAASAGAGIERMADPQIGWCEVELTADAADDPVLGRLPESFTGFQWHSYATPLPEGAAALARDGGDGRVDAFRIGEAWGLQFHAEVTREIVAGWLDRYREDEDAVRIGLEPGAILAETDERIADWNAVGERIAGAFLDHADRLGP
jgi:GMP synthase (glutamine-hydrolysing)